MCSPVIPRLSNSISEPASKQAYKFITFSSKVTKVNSINAVVKSF